jgi:hypothetical protein
MGDLLIENRAEQNFFKPKSSLKQMRVLIPRFSGFPPRRDSTFRVKSQKQLVTK